jgi:hypothetical protein
MVDLDAQLLISATTEVVPEQATTPGLHDVDG